MSLKLKLANNAIFMITQILFVTISGLFLYRYLLDCLGTETFGAWSLLMALLPIVQIAGFGLSASVVKFIAKFVSLGDYQRASQTIETALITVAFLVGFFLLLLMPFMKHILSIFVTGEQLYLLIDITPYIFVVFWFTSLSVVLLSSLEGINHFNLRSLVVILTSILHFFVSLQIVPIFGLFGLVYSQILQSVLLVILSWIFLRRNLHSLSIIPWKWDFDILKDLYKYGINLQFANLSQILYDPTTKGLLAIFGNLTIVTYYNLSSWLVIQLRSVLISINQVIVPTVAECQEKEPESIKSLFSDSFKVINFLSILQYSAIISLGPIFLVLWTNKFEEEFLYLIILLCVGYFFNSLSNPAYFVNLGTGKLFWNTISHVSTGIFNVFFAILLGTFFGYLGVVSAWSLSLIIGALIVVLPFQSANNVGFRKLFTKNDFLLIITALISNVIISFSYIFIISTQINLIVAILFISFIYFLLILIPTLVHPVTKNLISLFFEIISSKR